MEHPSEGAIHFDRFTIDLRRGSLRSGVDEIWLRPKSFAVLRYLAQNAGRLISKDVIFAAVWPDSTVTDDSLVQCIGEIRYALRDGTQRFVKAVPRRGYLFDSPISWSDTQDSVGNAQIIRIDEEFAHRLSIAVMPLINVSGDPAYDYLAD